MKHQRDEFISEWSCRPVSAICATRCHAAEGGTSGKNSTTDQRQVQTTSGGAQSPTIGSDGSINTGTAIDVSGWGATVNLTDQGAVDAAFNFGADVLGEVGKVLVGANATQAATVSANTDFLKAQTDLIASNSAGGATAQQNKTLLYVVGAAILAIVAIIFLRR